MTDKISIVIPVYNAQTIIASAIKRLTEFCSTHGIGFEIVLRDDGSADDSASMLKEAQANCENVRCFYNEKNYGLGWTLRRLFEDARYENIFCFDCDLPFTESAILPLIEKISMNDIVVISRYQNVRNKIPFLRWLFSRSYYWLCHLFFGIRVKDLGSGTFAIKKTVAAGLDLRAEGFDIHLELYAKAQAQKKKICEEGAAFSPLLQEGSFRILKHGPLILTQTWRLWRTLRQG